MIALVVLGLCAVIGAIAAVAASRAGRRHPEAPASRSAIVAVVGGAVAVGSLAVYALGIAPAIDGSERIRDATPTDDSPARARLFLHQVKLPAGADRVGYSPDAAVVLPRSYRLLEAERGWDLLSLDIKNGAATIAPIEPPESTHTRVRTAATSGPPTAADVERLRRRCADPSVDTGATGPFVSAVLCYRTRPRALLSFEPAGDGAVLTPAMWRGRRFEPHHIEIEASSLVQIGAADAALPGITLWEVPTPAGRSELFAAPDDLLGACDSFESSVYAGEGANLGGRGAICPLPYSPPFALEVRRLLPDTSGVAFRGLWSLGLLLLPLFGWGVLLAARSRGELRRGDVAALVRFAALTCAIAGVCAIRLLWAHRIDMLRDWEVAGARTAANQLSISLLAAGLAGFAAIGARRLLGAPRPLISELRAGLIGFGALFALARFGVPEPLAASGSTAGQLLLALALATAPIWHRRAAAAAAAFGARSPMVAALGLGAIAVVASLIAERAVALKLAIAWSAVIVACAAVRSGVAGDDVGNRALSRAIAGALAAAALCCAVAVYDTGLAAVICAPGFLVAIALAGHDALFGDTAAGEVDSFRLKHAPLLSIQAGLIAAVLFAALVWSVAGLGSGDDGTLAQRLTLGAPNLLWLIAALFAAPAVIAWRRGDRHTATLYGGAAGLAVLGWFASSLAAELVLGRSAPAAQRYAIIADPGYALLSSPDSFLSGVTAWAETIASGAADVWRGEGYFGAQVVDPGVLLSIENDYLPVLVLREQGAIGTTAYAAAALGATALIAGLGRDRFRHGSSASRTRLAVAVVLGALIVYQPLASLGALPLTGVSWPGLGVDSPADLWTLVALLVWMASLGSPLGGQPRRRRAGTASDADLDRFDRELRGRASFRRRERLALAVAVIAVLAGVALVARASVFALRRPPPVAANGLASAPFAGLESAIDYARTVACDRRAARAGGDEPGPWTLRGQPSDPGTERFHRELVSRFDGAPLEHGLVSVDVGGDRCQVALDSRVLRKLRLREREPYRHARVRVVSRPMGKAALDRGELLSGNIVVRLRESAAPIDVPRAAGLYAARRVALAPSIAVAINPAGEVYLQREVADDAPPSWLFVSRTPAPERLRPLERAATWKPIESSGVVVLDRPALLVVGRGAGRSVWMFRAGGDDGTAPLVADDSAMITGERRRKYVYGNQLPELGWVNRFRRDMSLGLDGWIAAALDEYDPDREPPAIDCGTLTPEAGSLTDVCRPDPSTGVIECQIAVQPELAIRMRHLTELISAAPSELSGLPERPLPLSSSFFLMRGDTGEILASGGHVPGRASPAYAPSTPALETYLIRAREDRDPRTGRKLAPARRGESSAEKTERNRPAAVGSVIKPMMGRAFEQTAPATARFMILSGSPHEGARCRGGRHAIFGHCPPTDSLWNQRRALSTSDFIAYSANWYMAAIALFGTALPDGEVGLGRQGPALDLDELLTRDVGDHAVDWPLWTRRGGRDVIGADHKIDVAALRDTPMWRRFEALIGRPLCTGGNKDRCRAASFRRDVCAARALPLREVSADLRHLVSLGPDRFDFYPRLRRAERTVKRIPTREYLQFLRGSGMHPLGSLAQMTDAFNRLIYEANRDPLRHGGYKLAASWFPAPAAGQIPARGCDVGGGSGPVAAGLCAALTRGTASRSLGHLLGDPAIELFGVKTGTVDSLGDIASSKKACESFREGRTLAGRRETAAAQPYWIECKRDARSLDDSLVLVSFAIKSDRGRVPLTLGLHFSRSGTGFAARVARHYIELARDYFGDGGHLK